MCNKKLSTFVSKHCTWVVMLYIYCEFTYGIVDDDVCYKMLSNFIHKYNTTEFNRGATKSCVVFLTVMIVATSCWILCRIMTQIWSLYVCNIAKMKIYTEKYKYNNGVFYHHWKICETDSHKETLPVVCLIYF